MTTNPLREILAEWIASATVETVDGQLALCKVCGAANGQFAHYDTCRVARSQAALAETQEA